MQNKKNFAFLKNLLQHKGRYIVALVCAAAVGVSGYLFMSQRNRAQLSSSAIPQVVEEPKDEKSTPPAQRNASVDAAALLPEAQEMQKTPESQKAQEDTATPSSFTIIMPVEGDLLQLYSVDHLSYNPTTRDWRVHDGIDICSGIGADVRAAADGTVASIYEDDALGTVLTISHANGYLTRYCNLSQSLPVSVGETVSQGDTIGYVGDTALMEAGSEEHLHFELCCNAVSLNPNDYFAW